MERKTESISDEKIKELLFYSSEFEIVLKKGREYVCRINPKLKDGPRIVIDEFVSKLVIEKCQQRFRFDSTGTLNTEYDVLKDVKRFVVLGRFLRIV